MLRILMHSFCLRCSSTALCMRCTCVVHALRSLHALRYVALRCMRYVTLRYVAINQFENGKWCVHGRKAGLVEI